MLRLDGHCHLDQYPNPEAVASEICERGIFTVAVTNLPSHFRVGLPYVRSFSTVRLALGLHPLASAKHERERKIFRECLHLTSFVGEVGLDFSREGKDTREVQLTSFRFVAESVATSPKVVSLHSRGAESAVLDILTEFNAPIAVFHWYSGSMHVLDEALSRGHFFSVNPAMVRSLRGQRILARIPPDRLLTETDGPYVKISGASAFPWDIVAVENHLALMWSIEPEEVRSRIWLNFERLLSKLGLGNALLSSNPVFTPDKSS